MGERKTDSEIRKVESRSVRYVSEEELAEIDGSHRFWAGNCLCNFRQGSTTLKDF